MTIIPNVILCASEVDKVAQYKKLLNWGSGKEFDTKFLTQEEIEEQGYVFDGHSDYYQPLKEDFNSLLDIESDRGIEITNPYSEMSIEDIKSRDEMVFNRDISPRQAKRRLKKKIKYKNKKL